MSKALLALAALIVLIVIGGGAFLATWNVPPPANHVEQVIPNAELGK